MREHDRLALSEIQVFANELELTRRYLLDAQPGRRLGEPVPHRLRRLAGSQFPDDGSRDDDLAIEAMQKLRLVEKGEVMKRPAVCDNDHRPARIPRSR
jgi:hypothetical protein